MELEERFWAKIDWNLENITRCWMWLGKPSYWGYGQFSFTDTMGTRIVARAHRLAYELLIEAPRLELDHICHDPEACRGGRTCPHRMCCNPHHLRQVSRQENHSPERKNTKAAGQAFLERYDPIKGAAHMTEIRRMRWAADARETWSERMREVWRQRSDEERRAIGRRISSAKRGDSQ